MNLHRDSTEASYAVTICDDGERIEVSVTNPEGAPIAGHADSTRTLSVGELLRSAMADVRRDWFARTQGSP